MSSFFGRKAADLCKEIAHCEPQNLPPYNDELVRDVLEECVQHDALRRDAAASPIRNAEDQSGLQSAISIHHQCILRNKRLLLAYHARRLDMIKALRWQHRNLPKEVEGNLSAHEKQAYRGYDQLLQQYMGTQGVDLNLLLDQMPPQDLNMSVIGLRNFGDVLTSDGMVHLLKGSKHTLSRMDAEHLIQEGMAKQVDERF